MKKLIGFFRKRNAQSKNNETFSIPKMKVLSNAPCDDESAFKNYKYLVGALETAISNPKNKNIGLIGDYGSGKSSALAVFKRINNQKQGKLKRKIVTISLADFCSSHFTSDNDLQFSIVQQLFHYVKRKQIPSSSFVKKGFRYRVFFSFLFFLLFALCLGLGFLAKSFPQFCGYRWMPFSFSAIFGLVFIVLICRILPFSSFKAKFKDIEVEFNSYKRNNLFDYFLEEIIYFFKKTKTDIVIFEDIDRISDCEQLFSKLYTLNVCLNNAPSLKKADRSIVFIHAVKETIFPDGEEKSKYFDVLLPVRPIFNKGHALSIMESDLKQFGYNLSIFEDSFVDSMSVNVSYNRQLNNLINAFNVIYHGYDKNLSKKKASSLMCVLLYKSLYPYDYINALKERGIAYFLFDEKFKNKNFETYLLNDEYCVSELYKVTPSGKIPEITEIDSDNEKTKKILLIKKYRKEERIFNEIDLFKKTFDSFFDETAFELIVSKSQSEFPENVQIYFSDLINKREVDYIDYVFDDAKLILESKIFKENIGNDASINLSLFEIISNDEKLHKLRIQFECSFAFDSKIKRSFIVKLYSKSIKSNQNYIVSFFKNLGKYYCFTNEAILKEITTNLDAYFDFIIKNAVYNLESFEKQNANNLLIVYLTSNYSLDCLVQIEDELFMAIFNAHPSHFDYLYFSNNNKKSLENKMNYIINSNMFVCSRENIFAVYQFLKNGDFNNDFLTIFYERVNTLNYVLDNYADRMNEFGKIIFDYSNENPDVVFDLMATNSHDLSRLPYFYETIPNIRFKDTKAIRQNYILSLYNYSKLTGNLDELGYIWMNFKNFKMVTYLKNNPFLLLKGNPKTNTGEEYLYRILSSEICSYALAKHLLVNCLESYILRRDFVFKNSEAANAILEYGSIEVTNAFIQRLTFDQFILITNGNNFQRIIENIEELSLPYEYLDVVFNKIKNRDELAIFINKKCKTVLSNFSCLKRHCYNANFDMLNNEIIVALLFDNDLSTQEGMEIFLKSYNRLSSSSIYDYVISQIINFGGVLTLKVTDLSTKVFNLIKSRKIRKSTSKKYNEFHIRLKKK